MTNDLAFELGDEADEAMRALVEPRRRAILRLVAHEELAAGEIAAAFDVNRTTVSQHLTVLKPPNRLVGREIALQGVRAERHVGGGRHDARLRGLPAGCGTEVRGAPGDAAASSEVSTGVSVGRTVS